MGLKVKERKEMINKKKKELKAWDGNVNPQ